MLTKEDTEMNVAWGRALVGIGVIVAFLSLGALEIFTARLPAMESSTGREHPGDVAASLGQDILDGPSQLAGRDSDAMSVNERSESDRTVVATDGWRQ
ncbi:MAG TPA: hypothetical protein VMS64_04515 [Candidatus Methylomirabilis sp.]|nr:hypothetical protein [Candidatus Methylomirabilis sp.]